MTPSPQQQAVVDWAITGSGSLNLKARAGCGKTSALLLLVQALHEANPEWNAPIFLGAFNKGIAQTLKEKLKALGLEFPFVEAATMHGLGFRLWRSRAPRVQVNEDKVQGLIYNARDDWMDKEAANLKQAVSLAKQSGCGALWDPMDSSQWYELLDHYAVECDEMGKLVRHSQSLLASSIRADEREIDFDDMLLAPLVHKVSVRKPYKWVLIDEAQDTNATRRALALSILMPNAGRLVAVGDDRQAIYGFTGADATSMNEFKDALGSTELPLTVTYRCPKAVVRHANKFVPDLEAHESAPEGSVSTRFLVEEAKEKDEFSHSQFLPSDAILCRNTAPLISLAYTFLSKRIPARVEGRDIGKGLKKLASKWKVTSLEKLEIKLDEHLSRESAKWMAKGKPDRAGLVADQVDSLKCLIYAAQDQCKGRATLSDLLDLIEQMFRDTAVGDRSILTLSTIHKAKGREWPRVFIFNRSLMPSPYARQEWQMLQEANLHYVAITRAMEELIYLEAQS